MNLALGQNDCYLCYISAIWEGSLCVTAELTEMVQYISFLMMPSSDEAGPSSKKQKTESNTPTMSKSKHSPCHTCTMTTKQRNQWMPSSTIPPLISSNAGPSHNTLSFLMMPSPDEVDPSSKKTKNRGQYPNYFQVQTSYFPPLHLHHDHTEKLTDKVPAKNTVGNKVEARLLFYRGK